MSTHEQNPEQNPNTPLNHPSGTPLNQTPDLPPGVYLANAPAAPSGTTSGPDLGDLQGEVVEARLKRKLEEIGETVAAIEERHRDDYDPAPVGLLEALCRQEGAPLEFRSLLSRVEAGAVTWQQIWDHPGAYDGGLRLMGLAVTRQHHDALEHHGPAPDTDQPEKPEGATFEVRADRWSN